MSQDVAESMNAHKESYKFNEITSLTGVKPYVLRFWEAEFEHIAPSSNELGQKIYTKADLETIRKIKNLLFDEKMSIPQAKGYLDQQADPQTELLSDVIAAEGQNGIAQQGEELKQALESAQVQIPVDVIAVEATPESEVDMPKKDAELKDQILNKRSNTTTAMRKTVQIAKLKAESNNLAIKKWKQENGFSEKDIVKLINAKKKLHSLLGKIDSLMSKYHWEA